MNVVNRPNLKEAVERFKDHLIEAHIEAWLKVVKPLRWNSLVAVQESFPRGDLVGGRLVFNMLHNRYRLICVVVFKGHTLYFKHLIDHAEYDRKKWKGDCRE